jgi:hypothetical protein
MCDNNKGEMEWSYSSEEMIENRYINIHKDDQEDKEDKKYEDNIEDEANEQNDEEQIDEDENKISEQNIVHTIYENTIGDIATFITTLPVDQGIRSSLLEINHTLRKSLKQRIKVLVRVAQLPKGTLTEDQLRSITYILFRGIPGWFTRSDFDDAYRITTNVLHRLIKTVCNFFAEECMTEQQSNEYVFGGNDPLEPIIPFASFRYLLSNSIDKFTSNDWTITQQTFPLNRRSELMRRIDGMHRWEVIGRVLFIKIATVRIEEFDLQLLQARQKKQLSQPQFCNL